MAASSTPSSSTSTTQEYTVRIPKDKLKSFSMMKFGSSGDLDFAKLGTTPISIARENNFKEFKTANDIDLMPKFGAGSEFGREQKEEARRKKYGRTTRTYNPDNQPWTMKIGTDKKAKRYKGVREGTITENTSYYIFTQCADGAFEAYPVEEWYNFTPVIKYKFLNSDEAEEHFSRRDKTLNYFNIMVKKRMNKDDGTVELEEDKSDFKNQKKSRREFMLTDQDEDWTNISEDEEGDDENGEQENGENMKGKDKKGKKKKGPIKKRKNAKINSDDEAVEESDEGDYDDKEVDYMSDSSSNPSEKEEEDKEKDTKDEEKGVAEEDGLRVLIDSEAEDEEENEEKEETLDDIDKDQKTKKEDESESSSSSSASDSDIEKDESISSALFMAKGSGKKKSDSRPATPNIEDRGIKRKMELDDTNGKKARTNSPVPTTTSASVTSSSSNSGSSSEGITEEAIRRYLMRKPMTTKDLLTKFRSKKLNMTSEQMTHIVAQLLKKINPDRKFINKVLYLSLKKTD